MKSQIHASSVISDFAALTKPRISLLCILMFVGGYLYSVVQVGESLFSARFFSHLVGSSLLLGMLGTWASVASANVLNMYWERKSDKLMERTASRPLPSGRMKSSTALVFGVVLAVISALSLVRVNETTLLLGLFALGGYVLIYTPLKSITPQALLIGAVPGAMPPLMGWTAHSGGIDSVGLVLFGILLLWQVPHFIAIAISHKEDYRKAGIQVLPVVSGEKRAVTEALVYSFALLAVSLLLVPLAKAGSAYAITATVLGLWLIVLCLKGMQSASKIWARKLFLASLVYLPVLTLVLVAESLLRGLIVAINVGFVSVGLVFYGV